MKERPSVTKKTTAAVDPDAWLPPSGEIVAGRYRIERVIGRGGMGSVVAATHVQLGERVAIKFLHPQVAADADNLARFVREAKISSRIKCEHVIRVLDVGTTDHGLPYIAMELLEGTDLDRLLGDGPLPIPLAVDCVLQAAEGLAEAHAAGVVHRDIKPSNLWLSRRRDGSPVVKILDFGISKLVPTSGSPGQLTETRAVFGSPSYMSPEQIRSAKHVDYRADVWALGVVLYELIAGRLPFHSDNIAGVLTAVALDAPPSLRAMRPDVPVALEQTIVACLEKDPNRRSSLKALCAGLRPFASPAGLGSADRIEHVGPPLLGSLPPPAPSPSMTSESTALGVTQAAIATSSGPKRALSSWTVRALMGATLIALVLGVAKLAVPRREPSDGASSAAQAASRLPPSTRAAPLPSEGSLPSTEAPPSAPAASAPELASGAAAASAVPSSRARPPHAPHLPGAAREPGKPRASAAPPSPPIPAISEERR